MALADRIAVMSSGKILQIGAPQDLYDFPDNRSVGAFLGSMNEFQGAVQDNGCIKIEFGVVQCAIPDGMPQEVIVAIRPEDIQLSAKPYDSSNEFKAQLVSRLFLGDITVCRVSVNGNQMRGKTTDAGTCLELGSTLYVRFPPEKIKVFAR